MQQSGDSRRASTAERAECQHSSVCRNSERLGGGSMGFNSRAVACDAQPVLREAVSGAVRNAVSQCGARRPMSTASPLAMSHSYTHARLAGPRVREARATTSDDKRQHWPRSRHAMSDASEGE